MVDLVTDLNLKVGRKKKQVGFNFFFFSLLFSPVWLLYLWCLLILDSHLLSTLVGCIAMLNGLFL